MKKLFCIFILSFLLITILEGCTLQKETTTNQNIFKNDFVDLKDGDSYNLTADYSGKMLAFNGSIPGPTLRVPQGAEITVNFTNKTDIPLSIHSHGVRLEDKFDGVVDIQQPAVKKNETFKYKLKFPDAGVFWYHPHLNEAYTQPLGLYGNLIVVPKDKNYWSPVNDEISLMLSDVLVNGQPERFNAGITNYALMGKFGNLLLVNGVDDFKKSFKKGEVIKFFITNASNTRVYNLSIPGTKIKLVGGDNGKYENETWQDEIVLSPSERAIIDVLFEEPGNYPLMNINPQKSYKLAEFNVSGEKAWDDFSEQFKVLRENKDVIADIDNYRKWFEKPADKSITLSLDMHDMGSGMGGMMGGNMMNDRMDEGLMESGVQGDSDGIEWEDTMPMMNAMSTNKNVKWKIIDDQTKKENMDINWKFKIGEKIKIKIFNDPKSMHPMQHPIHIHGQRFLVLSTNGIENKNLGWKDSVLVAKGDTVEILVDISNPGKWMLHCHISEHLESGMMLPFEVK